MADGNNMINTLQIGLKTASLRGRTIASNLANIDTPGYRRKAVKFEEKLREALESGEEKNLDQIAAEVFEPRNTRVEENGNDVDVSVEVGEMVDNSTRYKTYMRTLTKIYRQMEVAMQIK